MIPNSINQMLLVDDEYRIPRSIRLRSSVSASLSRTFSTTGTDNTKRTISMRIKRGKLSSGTQGLFAGYDGSSSSTSAFYFDSADTLTFQFGGAAINAVTTNSVFRDTSAWYTLLLAIDTTQSTASNRVKIYVDNVQLTSFSGAVYPAQNSVTQLLLNNANNRIGSIYDGTSTFDGLITEVHVIDGQALDPSFFGQNDTITGVWNPKPYSGTYGTNGFYLKFLDNSAVTATAIGKDYSGNANNWTPNNISLTFGITYDSFIDSPTNYNDGGNGRGNYATINPLNPLYTGTVSDGNLKMTFPVASIAGTYAITDIIPAGVNIYFEANLTSYSVGDPANNAMAFGLYSASALSAGIVTNCKYGWFTNGSSMFEAASYSVNAVVIDSANLSTTAFIPTDVLGVGIVGNVVSFYKNGTLRKAFTTSFTDFVPILTRDGSSNGAVWSVNFGQQPFQFPPSGSFKAFNTQNYPTPIIPNPKKWFDVLTYVGTGVARTITGFLFGPDLAWFKSRSAAHDHGLLDTTRGVLKTLGSNLTSVEVTTTDTITSFNSDGYTLGAGTSPVDVNASGSSLVSWNWKKGVTPGFDIVAYNGTGVARTIPHSAGSIPSFIVVKNLDGTNNWITGHGQASFANYTNLNTINGNTTSSTVWNSTNPTSSVFSVGTDAAVNTNGNRYIAYVWAEIPGFSKFGFYFGNGSTNGPLIYCGFRPRYVMIKRTDSIGDWQIIDTSRSPVNLANVLVYANLSNAEETATETTIDILSNGFKIRSTHGNGNASGAIYIFAAFAETPFKYARAR